MPAPRSQHMRIKYMFIKYMFIVQRYGLMPAAAGGFFAPRMWSLTGIVGFGGQRPGGSGAAKPATAAMTPAEKSAVAVAARGVAGQAKNE